jgi:hypothetical protein
MEEQIIAKDALLFVAHDHVIALLAWTLCSSSVPATFAGAIMLSNCPSAPQLKFLTGWPNTTIAAVNGLILELADNVDKILAQFADAGNFSPFEVMSLLASNSIARVGKVNPTIIAAPFDMVSAAAY